MMLPTDRARSDRRRSSIISRSNSVSAAKTFNEATSGLIVGRPAKSVMMRVGKEDATASNVR